jgi:hypothetical protein
MRHTAAAVVPTGDILAHVGDWTKLPTVELIGLMLGTSPVSAGASAELERLIAAMAKDPPARELLASKDEREIDRLILLVPPRHGKTELASVSRESRSEFRTPVDGVRARAVSSRVESVGGWSSQRTENVILEARRIGGGAGWGLCRGICASEWFRRFTRKA